jgi:ectoine hydroxylase-related dioxygenase (phytanoyl-CoA dioxygenase family)
MASSLNSIVAWVNIFPIQNEQHTLEIVPRSHTNGLHRGRQSEQGYILDQQIFEESIRLVVPTGSLLLFSPWLVHRTFVSPTSNKTKLAVSRRFDDLACSSWKKRGMQNAYQTTVDRNLYLAY